MLRRRSKSNMNELIMMLDDKSSRNNDSDLSSKNEDKDDVFEKELIISQERGRTKKPQSQRKNDQNNLNIFQKLIITSELSLIYDPNKIENEFFPEESFLKQPFPKENNHKGFSNTTLKFDKKNEDVFLSIPNIQQDFLENSIDENFKKDFLEVETKENTKVESESFNTILNNRQEVKLDNHNLTSIKTESFLERNKRKILICILILILSLVFIKL